MRYEETLEAESRTWLLPEPERREKFRRERIRHYRLIRDLLLDRLDVHNMDILEIGGGPMPVSDLLRFRSRLVIDPLSDDYRTVIPCPDHVAMRAEDLEKEGAFDLAISTNSLDHVESPELVVAKMAAALRPGGFMAVQCAENNAIVHPHAAHVHNISAEWLHRLLDADFETVSEWTWREHGYRYGWVLYEGRRGQPAFALLLRKCSGYT